MGKFKSQYWAGLESGYVNSKTPPALLDGSVNHGNWFYAVGSTDKWGAGIPGASDAETQVELYVKCKLEAKPTKAPPATTKKPTTPQTKPGWKLLLRQTSPYFLKPASKWLSVNPTKPTGPNYSVLNTLDNKCKDDKGKFQFKLVWPQRKGANYNIWKQSTNPVTEKTKVQGYEAVDVKFKSQLWGGLESGYVNSKTPPALLDGSVNHGNWYYAVGSTGKWGAGIPGASDAET